LGGFFAVAGTALINDVFSVYQRGIRVGTWNFAVIVSINITPLISGYIIVALSWRWSFFLLAIFFGVLLVLIFFLCPETTFYRDEPCVMEDTPVKPRYHVSLKKDEGPVRIIARNNEVGSGRNSADTAQGSVITDAPRWKRFLGISHLQFTGQSRIFSLCISPFTLLRHPAALWACAMWAVTFTWVIIQGTVAVPIFGAPPYNMSPTSIGNLIGIAPMIGSVLGTLVGVSS
jgi:MFS family permease